LSLKDPLRRPKRTHERLSFGSPFCCPKKEKSTAVSLRGGPEAIGNQVNVGERVGEKEAARSPELRKGREKKSCTNFTGSEEGSGALADSRDPGIHSLGRPRHTVRKGKTLSFVLHRGKKEERSRTLGSRIKEDPRGETLSSLGEKKRRSHASREGRI